MSDVISTATPNVGKTLERILKWKTERKAVILAHNYQPDDVQAAADYTGDSLELARLAAKTDAEVIAFAGVTFMAESAKILSPQKTVLLPVREAGCPLADTINAEDLRREKEAHPNAAVVVYINSSAEVKAEADVCCTSANAVQVVNSLDAKEIIFAPDKNLGHWVASHSDKQIIPWAGSCCTHNNISVEDVATAMHQHPNAAFIAHPECRPEVCQKAVAVLSTSQMIRYTKSDAAPEYIVGTENGLLFRLRNENKHKKFHSLTETMICKTMKMTSLEDVANALEYLKHPIEVDEVTREKAVNALDAMLRIH